LIYKSCGGIIEIINNIINPSKIDIDFPEQLSLAFRKEPSYEICREILKFVLERKQGIHA